MNDPLKQCGGLELDNDEDRSEFSFYTTPPTCCCHLAREKADLQLLRSILRGCYPAALH